MKSLKNSFSLVLVLGIMLTTHHVLSEPPAATHEQKPIQLGSSFLHFVDGQPYGITAYILGWLLQIRLMSKHILYGNPASEKMFTYRKKKYTLKEMAIFEIKEEKLYKERCAQRQAYSDSEWKDIEKEHTLYQKELHESLIEAKNKFSEFLLPFLHNIQPMKKQIVPLMLESCEMRGHPESLLPKCVGLADGTEVAAFKQATNSYKQLGMFCLDLIHFLTDLIYSCPKARAQFEELRKSQEGAQSILDSLAD
jgi:hypothetical protein